MTKKNYRKRLARTLTPPPPNASDVERVKHYLDNAAILSGVRWSLRGDPYRAQWSGLAATFALGTRKPEVPVRLHHRAFGVVDIGYASESGVNRSRRTIGRMGSPHPLVDRFCDAFESLNVGPPSTNP